MSYSVTVAGLNPVDDRLDLAESARDGIALFGHQYRKLLIKYYRNILEEAERC